MKKIDVGQTVAVVANLGVIAGIVFLAVELQQNNQLLRSEAVGALLETRMIQNEQMSSNPELAAVMVKNVAGETLSEIDLQMLRAFYARGKMGWQRDYFLYQEGILSEEYMRTNIPIMRRAFADDESTYSGYDHWIENWREIAPVDYREFIEACVLAECESFP